MNREDVNEAVSRAVEKATDELAITVSDAFESLPLLARLLYVRDLLLISGGEVQSAPSDPRLVVATQVLKGAIEIVETRPRIAKLSAPQPK